MKYRYYTADLLTGNVLGELPLYGVYATKNLSSPGDFNGTFALDAGDAVGNAVKLAASMPARTALYMERNNELIWGGILWTRTYASQGQTMQLAARTFDSYFDHMVFMDHFIQQSVNQEIIFQRMLNQLQGQPASNIGLTLTTPLPTTNTPRTILVPNYEFHFGSETLQALTTEDLGLEYKVDVLPTATQDHPEKRITLGFPLGSSATPQTYDYPGTIANYWMPESGANGGVKFAALGFGTGNKVARATYVDQDTISEGYPAWWRVDNFPTVADTLILQDKANANGKKYKMPYKSPTFELRSDEGVGFTGWNALGEPYNVHIEDVRYPAGFDIQSRIIGWEFSPASAEGPETLKFAIDGSDV